jgi:hypothetical protein
LTGNTPHIPQGIFTKIRKAIGDRLAIFLSAPRAGYSIFSTLTKAQLVANLKPGDLLLVEGNSRISTAIKYLTQSTWSHVCIFIGEQADLQPILEVDLVDGVITVPIDKYNGFNLRICRPVNLTPDDTQKLIEFVVARIGHQYDNKHIADLVRYLLPTPPVPQRFRRSLLEFGSGDPTKAICSTLVAQAFQSIRYPILPLNEPATLLDVDNEPVLELAKNTHRKTRGNSRKKNRILTKRHYSHFTPRDFDLSPYFAIVKPTLSSGFRYKDIVWEED